MAGTNEVALFRALAIKHALRLYAGTGMRANRAYTPKAMMTAASSITGQTFKARDYRGAIDALEAWCKARMPSEGAL